MSAAKGTSKQSYGGCGPARYRGWQASLQGLPVYLWSLHNAFIPKSGVPGCCMVGCEAHSVNVGWGGGKGLQQQQQEPVAAVVVCTVSGCSQLACSQCWVYPEAGHSSTAA